MIETLAALSADMVRDLAASQGVCVRPIMRRVLDRETGSDSTVAIACGSTRQAVCPPRAEKVKALRMAQCSEGWHRTDEPERVAPVAGVHQDMQATVPDSSPPERQVRSTRRRDDPDELPRVLVEDRTVGRVFATPDGRQYRPSMFVTLTSVLRAGAWRGARWIRRATTTGEPPSTRCTSPSSWTDSSRYSVSVTSCKGLRRRESRTPPELIMIHVNGATHHLPWPHVR